MQPCKLKIFLLASGFWLLTSALPARAQFLGYTSPQSITTKVFNDYTGAGTLVPVRNIGQTTHYLFYNISCVGACHMATFLIYIEASYDNSVFFRISQSAVNPNTGSLFAVGYYPFVQIHLDAMSASSGVPKLNAWYSGTSTAPSLDRGTFGSSGVYSEQLTLGADRAISGGAGSFTPAYQQAGGYLFFHFYNTGPALTCTGTFPYITVQTTASDPGGSGNALIAQFPLRCDLTTQVFTLPNMPANSMSVSYNVPGGTVISAGLYEMDYAISTTPPDSTGVRFAPLSTVATTPGMRFATGFSLHTVELVTTGAPAACSFQLEGSLDSTTGTDGTWFNLSGAVDCSVAANNMFHVANKLVPWVRGNVTALSPAATVTMYYNGKH